MDSLVTKKAEKKVQFSRVMPLGKFIIMCLATFGIYELVWFYKNWTLLKEEKGLKISPFWRAVFAPIWIFVLTGKLQMYLKEKNSPSNFSPITIAVLYFVLSASWKMPNPYSVISYLSFVPVLTLVSAMNIYWQPIDQGLPTKKLTWWQLILVIMGLILFVLAILGSFVPDEQIIK